jgi:hypothetical protein
MQLFLSYHKRLQIVSDRAKIDRINHVSDTSIFIDSYS